MFAHTNRIIGMCLIAVTVLSGCKSGDEEPSEDYLVLGAASASVLNGVYWSGTITESKCSVVTGDITETATFCEGSLPYWEGKILATDTRLTVSLPSQTPISGTVQIVAAHPDSATVETISVPVNGTVGVGYETGNGPARALSLSQQDPTAAFGQGSNFRLVSFQADQGETELNGSFVLLYVRSSGNAVVTYTFNIDKVY